MKTQWCPIYDAELGTYTFIAPRTGHLMVSTVDYRNQAMRAMLRLLLGTSKKGMGNSEFHRAQIIDGTADRTTIPSDPHAARIRFAATVCLGLLPLSTAIVAMRLLFRLSSTARVNLDEAIHRTAMAFGRRSKQDCLRISLCRHAYLRQMGIPSRIMLGAHVPTEKMHAWVQIGEQPVLECPDVMVHYQTCVAYI